MSPARKLLIVDDSALMRATIVRCCTQADDLVIEAANGAEAIERFADHRPDWIIMDVQMPGMDGFSATRAIVQGCTEARVIILTQHNSPDYREEARAAGACAFVSKDDLSRLNAILRCKAFQAVSSSQTTNQ